MDDHFMVQVDWNTWVNLRHISEITFTSCWRYNLNGDSRERSVNGQFEKNFEHQFKQCQIPELKPDLKLEPLDPHLEQFFKSASKCR